MQGQVTNCESQEILNDRKLTVKAIKRSAINQLLNNWNENTTVHEIGKIGHFFRKFLDSVVLIFDS